MSKSDLLTAYASQLQSLRSNDSAAIGELVSIGDALMNGKISNNGTARTALKQNVAPGAIEISLIELIDKEDATPAKPKKLTEQRKRAIANAQKVQADIDAKKQQSSEPSEAELRAALALIKGGALAQSQQNGTTPAQSAADATRANKQKLQAAHPVAGKYVNGKSAQSQAETPGVNWDWVPTSIMDKRAYERACAVLRGDEEMPSTTEGSNYEVRIAKSMLHVIEQMTGQKAAPVASAPKQQSTTPATPATPAKQSKRAAQAQAESEPEQNVEESEPETESEPEQSTSADISLDSLKLAKHFVSLLGGLSAAQSALSAYAELVAA